MTSDVVSPPVVCCMHMDTENGEPAVMAGVLADVSM
jgi:hypothetical protein